MCEASARAASTMAARVWRPFISALGAAASAGGASSVSEARESKEDGPDERSGKNERSCYFAENRPPCLPFVEEIALEDPDSRVARRPMKVAVVGLGAVGGLIAARMAAAGHAVSALARGETLARVRERGLVVDSAGKRSVARIVVAEEARALGPQDLVVIALKAPALAALAPQIARAARPSDRRCCRR